MDDLGLEQPGHALSEGVVIAVVDAADRGLDAGFGQPLGVPDAHILRSAVAMMDEALGRSAGMQRLLQGVESEAGRLRAADPPAHDAPGEDIDNESDVDHAGPSAHIGQVRDPEHVRRRSMELSVDQIERASRRFIRPGCPDHLAAHHALQPEPRHQPGDAGAADLDAFAVKLQPHLLCAVDANVLLVGADDFLRQPLILLRARGAKIGIVALRRTCSCQVEGATRRTLLIGSIP